MAYCSTHGNFIETTDVGPCPKCRSTTIPVIEPYLLVKQLQAKVESLGRELAAKEEALYASDNNRFDLANKVIGLEQQLVQAREALSEIRTVSSNEIYVGGIVPLGSANLKLDAIRRIAAEALKEEVERLKRRWGESVDLVTEVEERSQRAEAQLAQAREALEESSKTRLDKLFPLFTLGEIQLLIQGIHLIGEQNCVDENLIHTWRRLRDMLKEALEKTAAKALAQKESPTAASLVGTAPVICQGCGKEINPDYGRCQRCG